MNYIKQLQQDNQELKARIDNTDAEIRDFIRLLNSSKHNGVDTDGTRSDWIATSDTLGRLGIIQDTLFNLNS
tara:strand:- start:237 stop:452 length:216 start_codon:yes stop_codon:yes gene_type:complete